MKDTSYLHDLGTFEAEVTSSVRDQACIQVEGLVPGYDPFLPPSKPNVQGYM